MAASMDFVNKPVPSGDEFNTSVRAELDTIWEQKGFIKKKVSNKDKFITEHTQEVVKQKFAELIKPFDGVGDRNIRAALLDDKHKATLKANMSNLMTIFSEHSDDLGEFQVKMESISNSLRTHNVDETQIKTQSYVVSVQDRISSSQTKEELTGILNDFFTKSRKDLNQAKKLQDPTKIHDATIAILEANYRILREVNNKIKANPGWLKRNLEFGMKANKQFDEIKEVLNELSEHVPDKQRSRVVEKKMISEIETFYSPFLSPEIDLEIKPEEMIGLTNDDQREEFWQNLTPGLQSFRLKGIGVRFDRMKNLKDALQTGSEKDATQLRKEINGRKANLIKIEESLVEHIDRITDLLAPTTVERIKPSETNPRKTKTVRTRTVEFTQGKEAIGDYEMTTPVRYPVEIPNIFSKIGEKITVNNKDEFLAVIQLYDFIRQDMETVLTKIQKEIGSMDDALANREIVPRESPPPDPELRDRLRDIAITKNIEFIGFLQGRALSVITKIRDTQSAEELTEHPEVKKYLDNLPKYLDNMADNRKVLDESQKKNTEIIEELQRRFPNMRLPLMERLLEIDKTIKRLISEL